MFELKDDNGRQGLEDIQKVFLFRGLDFDEANVLAAMVEEVDCPDGTVIVEQDQIGEALYIVRQGSVEISTEVEGNRILLNHLSTWDFFGEMSLITSELTTARVSAAGPVKLFRLHGDRLKQAAEVNPTLGMKIYRAFAASLAKRLQSANEDRVASLLAMGRDG